MKDVKKLIHLGVDGIISDIPMIYLNYNKNHPDQNGKGGRILINLS